MTSGRAGGPVEGGGVEQELRLRHLQDVAAIVARLSQYSFVIRGWSLTLASIVLAIIGTRSDVRAIALAALAPFLMFWGLDAYYNRQERLFRRLYQAVGQQLAEQGGSGGRVALFDMDTTPYRRSVDSFARTLFAPHIAAIPVVMAVLILVFGFAAA